MTTIQLANELHIWKQIETATKNILAGKTSASLLEKIAKIPIRRSCATRRLGVYVSQGSKPVCIRLQFAQEPENLRQTFLHEVAHACDHLSHKGLRKSYRKVHGDSWKVWAQALGISTATSGESETVRQLHQQRLKLVGVCQKCGAEFHRVRRFNRNGTYTHRCCGGEILHL